MKENCGGVKNLSKEWKIVSLWFQPHNYFDEDELDVFVSLSLARSLASHWHEEIDDDDG